jgi:hypothetical protein
MFAGCGCFGFFLVRFEWLVISVWLFNWLLIKFRQLIFLLISFGFRLVLGVIMEFLQMVISQFGIELIFKKVIFFLHIMINFEVGLIIFGREFIGIRLEILRVVIVVHDLYSVC